MADELDISGMSDREMLIYLVKTVPGRLSDHGRRLRMLERMAWTAGGVTGVIGLIWAAVKINIKAN